MSRVKIQSDCLGLRRRTTTRVLPYPWPFLYSGDPDGPGLVKNLPPWPLEEEAPLPDQGLPQKKGRRRGRGAKSYAKMARAKKG